METPDSQDEVQGVRQRLGCLNLGLYVAVSVPLKKKAVSCRMDRLVDKRYHCDAPVTASTCDILGSD